MAAPNLSQVLLDLQKASLYTVFEATVKYIKDRDDSVPLTAKELCEAVSEMPALSNVSLVVQKPSSGGKKTAEIDEKNGCQRIKGATSNRPHRPCGSKCYVNTATGDMARYCKKCIGLKTFRTLINQQLTDWEMSIEEATAGKLCGYTKPQTPNAAYMQQYAPQYVDGHYPPPGGQYSPPSGATYAPAEHQAPNAPQTQRIVHAPRRRVIMPAR